MVKEINQELYQKLRNDEIIIDFRNCTDTEGLMKLVKYRNANETLTGNCKYYSKYGAIDYLSSSEKEKLVPFDQFFIKPQEIINYSIF